MISGLPQYNPPWDGVKAIPGVCHGFHKNESNLLMSLRASVLCEQSSLTTTKGIALQPKNGGSQRQGRVVKLSCENPVGCAVFRTALDVYGRQVGSLPKKLLISYLKICIMILK
jgi:hypothetical protein